MSHPTDLHSARLARHSDTPLRRSAWARQRRFSPDMEARFLLGSVPARLRHFVTSGLMSLVAYNAFAVTDWLLLPDVIGLSLLLRLGLMTPFSLGLLWLQTHRRDIWLHRPHVAEGMIVLTGLLAATTMGILLALSHSPIAAFGHAGFMAVIVYGNIVQRLHFRHALVFTAGVLAVHGVSLLASHPQPEVVSWPIVLMNTFTALFTLIANHDMERDERERFWMRDAELTLLHKLQARHAQLEPLARQDALTGLANRHHMASYLRATEPSLRHQDGALDEGSAVLLLDVDHFKAYNDLHGHPGGDACLREVAQAIAAQVPQTLGLAARWGGEEFLVRLPRVSRSAALALAEAVHQAVQARCLPHGASPVGSHVSVSVGLAWRAASQGPCAIDDLIAEADTALYEAKRQGRNRVVWASEPSRLALC